MTDIQLLFRFLSYKLFSTGRKGHGVHSPFVFKFIQNVLNKSSIGLSEDGKNLLQWHLNLEHCRDEIRIVEMGAGSRKDVGSSVSIGKMIKKTGIRPKYGRLLGSLVQYYKSDKIIELGTGFGVSTVYLAKSLPDVELHTVEGDKARLTFAENEFRELGLKNILTYNESFDDFLARSLFKQGNYAIFLDGNHSLEPTLEYFNFFVDICDEDSFIVLDDINWSDEMRTAWQMVKRHPSVTISIDLFFMGIVFFRKGLAKQDYILNF